MDEQLKELYKANGNLHWFIDLYNKYRTQTDKPDFVDFMSWLS